jgi:hypothetical protein
MQKEIRAVGLVAENRSVIRRANGVPFRIKAAGGPDLDLGN